jgi:hypothetical protein
MASADHIHQETLVLPIEKHTRMLFDILHCFQPDHPGQWTHANNKTLCAKKLKPNIILRHEVVHPFTTSGLTNKGVKKGQKTIHDQAVRDCIEQYTANKVLNRPPPEIDKSEETLTRGARSFAFRLQQASEQLPDKNR